MENTPAKKEMKNELGLLDGTMLVAGSMIGSGIFIVSADIIRHVGSAGWLIAIWLLTGFMTLTAAVSYGELSAMFPKAGGQYVYLKEAYNKLIAFLYGWSLFAVIQTGTIAAVGVAFSKFAAYLIPAVSEDNILLKISTGVKSTGEPSFFTISAAQIVSIVLIIILTYINTKGVKGGKIIQTTFTMTKLLSLFGLIIFGFIMFRPEVWHANWSNAWNMHALNPDGSVAALTTAAALGAIAASMVGSIFSSDAWNNVTFIAGEMKNPKRNIGLSLFLGTLIVTIIYVSANVVYTAVLPLHEIATAEKDRVAVAASHVIFGNVGTVIIALMIMVSTFGCNNGLILAGARVYYTMAKDGLFFRKTGTLNKNAVPEFGLWIQCLVACLLCLSGRYGDLLDMISFVVVIFYVLTIVGIYILRVKRPDAERPYKAFGYPVLPAIYIIMGLAFCVLLIIYKPEFTWPGLIIVLIGIPIYYVSQRNVKDNDLPNTNLQCNASNDMPDQTIDINNSEHIRGLLLTLEAGARPLWGKMKPQQMIEHLIDEVQHANGKKQAFCNRPAEEAAESKHTWIYTDAVIPKNLILQTLPQNFSYADMHHATNKLMKELDDLHSHYQTPGITAVHAAYGAMYYNEWLVWLAKHFTHHFKQFNLVPSEV